MRLKKCPEYPAPRTTRCGSVPSYTDASAFTQYENCVNNGYSSEINSEASAANQAAAARNDLTEAMSQIDADYSQYTQAATTLGAALTQFIEGIRTLSFPSSDGQAVTAVVNASTALRNVIDNMISFTPSTPASQIASNNASLIAANQNLSDGWFRYKLPRAARGFCVRWIIYTLGRKNHRRQRLACLLCHPGKDMCVDR